VKTPLCNFCLKSGILCPKCESKVKTGELSELDIRTARLLLRLESKYPFLQDVHFYKTVEANGILALLVDVSSLPKILSYGGKIIREINDELGRKVRIIEHGGNLRKFLEDLFTPATIITLNRIWIPDGSTETRVILSKRDANKLPANINTLKELTKKIRGVTLRVEFEEERP